MKNQSLNLELISLKDLNALKNQELDSKNQIFEIFISELKEKFEKVKEKLLQEEKMKEILFIEQKEMLLKYKQVNIYLFLNFSFIYLFIYSY